MNSQYSQYSRFTSIIIVCLSTISALVSPDSANADKWILQQKVANWGSVGDESGKSIDASDRIVAVGKHSVAHDGKENSGEIDILTFLPDGSIDFLYVRGASDAQEGDALGLAVAASDDVVLAGAPMADIGGSTDQGAVYVYTRGSDGHFWETDKLTAEDGTAGDMFGWSVAMDGDTAVVGAWLNGNQFGLGAAYVFVKQNGKWVQKAKLMADSSICNAGMGVSVDISGETIVVGAYNGRNSKDVRSGVAYVFTFMSGMWQHTARLEASDGNTADGFGLGVAIDEDEDTVVVGAPWDDDLGKNSGSAYVFERYPAGWYSMSETVKLLPNGPGVLDPYGDWFGYAVDIHTNTIAVGSFFANLPQSSSKGKVYIYRYNSAKNWHRTDVLSPPDASGALETGSGFGFSVALHNRRLAIGAIWDDDYVKKAGAYYVFNRVRTFTRAFGSRYVKR